MIHPYLKGQTLTYGMQTHPKVQTLPNGTNVISLTNGAKLQVAMRMPQRGTGVTGQFTLGTSLASTITVSFFSTVIVVS